MVGKALQNGQRPGAIGAAIAEKTVFSMRAISGGWSSRGTGQKISEGRLAGGIRGQRFRSTYLPQPAGAGWAVLAWRLCCRAEGCNAAGAASPKGGKLISPQRKLWVTDFVYSRAPSGAAGIGIWAIGVAPEGGTEDKITGYPQLPLWAK